MFDITSFELDLISLTIGFVFATLFWWAFGRIQNLMPVFLNYIRQSRQVAHERQMAGLERTLREDVFKRAQKMHLATNLASLDEILIIPRLIAPSPLPDPLKPGQPESITSQFVPYLADWPELAAQYPVNFLDPLDAIRHTHLAIIGQPGCGKTTALAYMACRIAEAKHPAGINLPIFFHISELSLDSIANSDPVDLLIDTLKIRGGLYGQSKFATIIKDNFSHGKLTLLIDGLDELPVPSLTAASSFIHRILSKYPSIRIVVAASSHYLDGLTGLGFTPMPVSPWNLEDRKRFISQWTSLWENQILPAVEKQSNQPAVSSTILNSWISTEFRYLSPLEWTLKLWASFAGDSSGPALQSDLEAYLKRNIPTLNIIPGLVGMASEMVKTGQPFLAYDQVDQVLSQLRADQISGQFKETQATPARKKESKLSIGTQSINALISSGLFLSTANNQLRFCNPVLTGFLASIHLESTENLLLPSPLDYALSQQCYRFLASKNTNPNWLPLLDLPDSSPLFIGTLAMARWLKDSDSDCIWRIDLMKKITQLFQEEQLPLHTRARLIAALVYSADPALPAIFRQYLSSPSIITRQLAALACGSLLENKLLPDLVNLLSDESPNIRIAASLAITAIRTQSSLQAAVEILTNSDEGSRQAVAESLAIQGGDGHEILKECLHLPDLLARRASVFGLVQIHQPWVIELLEKIAVEDGQWVVRSAAGQAIEDIKAELPYLPQPLPPAYLSPWLLAYAAKRKIGIAAGEQPTKLLLDAFKTGKLEEKLAALPYLRSTPDEGVISAIYQAVYTGPVQLSIASTDILWQLATSGIKLPSPIKFGYE